MNATEASSRSCRGICRNATSLGTRLLPWSRRQLPLRNKCFLGESEQESRLNGWNECNTGWQPRNCDGDSASSRDHCAHGALGASPNLPGVASLVSMGCPRASTLRKDVAATLHEH